MKWTLTPDKYLNEEEVKRLVRVCSDAAEIAEKRGYWLAVRDWMIIDLTLNTGLRVQEVADLKVKDLYINYNESSLVVEKGKVHEISSGAVKRARHLSKIQKMLSD